MEEFIQFYNILNEHLQVDTVDSQVKATILSELDKDLHQLYLLGEIAKGMSSLSRKKRKRSIDPAPPRLFRLEDCPWFVYMSQGRHSDDNSREGKEFRKRFRVPWSFNDNSLKRTRSDDRFELCNELIFRKMNSCAVCRRFSDSILAFFVNSPSIPEVSLLVLALAALD